MSGSPIFRHRAVRGALVGLAGAAVALALWLPGLLESFEARTWDLRERAFARPAATSSQIALVLVDQESFDWGAREMGLSWPWPREIIAQVVDFCRLAGARALILDVLYTEPSSYGVEDDTRFGMAIASFGGAVGAVHLANDQGDATAWPAEEPRPGLIVNGPQPWSAAFSKATFPIPEIASAVRILGNTNLKPDGDNVYRRAPLFGTFDGVQVPSMGLAAWIAGSGAAPRMTLEPGAIEVGGKSVPVDGSGNAILRFRGPTMTHRGWRAAAIIRSAIQIASGEQPEVSPSELKDKYVFFGYSAPGLFDLRPSPMSGSYPGVEVHATMLDNLLAGDFLREVPIGWGILLLVALCIGAGVAASSVSGLLGSALVYVAFVPIAPAMAFGAYALGGWLQMVALELGTVVTLVGSSLANYTTEGRQKRYIKSAFRQYLSPTVIEELIAHPERLRLGGERRELSIYFSDLQGFTSLSEALTPEELTAVLNEYLSAMTDIIQDEGGTIDKYEGDAIIAFWNAPLSLDDHAVRAVRASLRCQARLAEIRPAFRQRVGKDLLMRIGLNSGPAIVGNMGSRTRFDYTMLGDAVNLASRLEGVNKQFKTYTMVSAAVVERIGGAFPVRELSRIAVVGRKEPVVVYEPMMPEEFAARRGLLEEFGRGLQAYYEGRFAEAVELFSQTADRDPPAAAYAERCRELAAHPPAGAWTGVWVMTSK
jgi:adenylate cyclase